MRKRELFMKTRLEILQKYRSQVIALYMNRDNTHIFIAGRLDRIDKENALLLKSMTNTGDNDGFLLVHLEHIYRIEYETQYLRKLAYLSERTKYDEIPEMGDCLTSLLTYATQQRKVIQVMRNRASKETSDIGIVKSFNDVMLELSHVDQTGNLSEQAIIFRNDIKLISCDTDTEKIL